MILASAEVTSCLSTPKRRIVSDILLGPIVFHGLEADILETAELARLRHIKQLATVYFFHPNATHTRWDHSVGVAALVKSFISAQRAFDIPIEDQLPLVAAALLHDIGHSAWSHVGELFTQMRGDTDGISHVQLSADLVTGVTKYDKHFDDWGLPRVREIITEKSQRMMIAELMAGRAPVVPQDLDRPLDEATRTRKIKEKAYLGNIVRGPASFDIAEYLMRDSFMTQSGLGLVNARRLIEETGIVQTEAKSRILSFLSLNFAECMILSGEQLFEGVYLETRNLITEELMRRALMKVYEPGTDIFDFWFSTDEDVLATFHKFTEEHKDPFIDRVSKLFNARQTYGVVGEVNLQERLDDHVRRNIRSLGSKAGRHRILDLERDVSSDLRIPQDDIVIGCLKWEIPDIYDAAVRIGQRDSTVEVESRLLEVLGTEAYANSRSRLVVGAWKDVSVDKSKIMEATLYRLRTSDYT